MSPGTAARVVVWLAVVFAAWFGPRRGEKLFRKLERLGSAFAQHRALSCVVMGLLVLGARLVLLPFWPIPKPYVYDEFGYILQSDTFALGRLTNAPHPMAPFFESIYLLQWPTYNAKFPPG